MAEAEAAHAAANPGGVWAAPSEAVIFIRPRSMTSVQTVKLSDWVNAGRARGLRRSGCVGQSHLERGRRAALVGAGAPIAEHRHLPELFSGKYWGGDQLFFSA